MISIVYLCKLLVNLCILQMLNRIQKIMDDKGLTVSSLADEIGVKRPTMTHTLSGRNNPSLDIISKILERFPEVSSDWLMFGKEP
ncbi:MAG: helix-turn-helix transcriptional regulator, partial [Bacteroidales bacterium]